ncbi:Conidial development fluffy [Fusarium acutatum]|uniref:Conidial development fluffy n=1 Tax=Fusarium acutatum TaxID=78861 RepID=A0A8H4JKU9_9HYPO|nr:Conidial development fluffy [Fusarium acutatum]
MVNHDVFSLIDKSVEYASPGWFEEQLTRYNTKNVTLQGYFSKELAALKAFHDGETGPDEAAHAITRPACESPVVKLGGYADELVVVCGLWFLYTNALDEWPSSRTQDLINLGLAISKVPDKIHQGEAIDDDEEPLTWRDHPYFHMEWSDAHWMFPEQILQKGMDIDARREAYDGYIKKQIVEAKLVAAGILPWHRACSAFLHALEQDEDSGNANDRQRMRDSADGEGEAKNIIKGEEGIGQQDFDIVAESYWIEHVGDRLYSSLTLKEPRDKPPKSWRLDASDNKNQHQVGEPLAKCQLAVVSWFQLASGTGPVPTLLPVSDEYASSILSVHFENEHAMVGTFDIDAFLDDLVDCGGEFCSSFLVSSLLCLAASCFSSLDSRAITLVTTFLGEAKALWKAERSSDSVVNLSALINLAEVTMMQGKDDISLELFADGRHMAERECLIGAHHTAQLSQKLRELPPKTLRASSHARSRKLLQWGANYINPSASHPWFIKRFPEWCKLWTNIQEIQALYYIKDSSPLQEVIPYAFVESKYRKLLHWADNLMEGMMRKDEKFSHVSVLHAYFHIRILYLFRPFLDLQRLVLDYTMKYDPRFYNFILNGAALHVFHATIKSKDTLGWRFSVGLLDFEVAMTSKHDGRAQEVAQTFEELALFDEF